MASITQKFPSTMSTKKCLNDPAERLWKGPFNFVVAADPQFGMIGTCKLNKPNPTWEPEMKLTREAIQKANAMDPKPKFFLVCGDMLDALPFDKDSISYYNNNDIVVRDQQYADFMKLFEEELDPEIKLVFVSGNHDVGDVPTKESLTKYRNEFGPDYFTFWVGGVKFVVLNSQFFYSPKAVPEETALHDKWIDENIADRTAKFIVVFQHIPFFGSDPNENTTYSNIPKDRRLVYLEKLWKAGVRHIFCGHSHKNDGGRYKDMTQIVTSALGAPFGNDPSGFRTVTVGLFDITHEYVRLRETTSCEEFAQENKIDKDEVDKKEPGEKKSTNQFKNNMLQGNWLWACCGAKTVIAEPDNAEPEVEGENVEPELQSDIVEPEVQDENEKER